jgi:hypothetical protein
VFHLGVVGGDTLTIGAGVTLTLAEAADAWRNGFERATSG